MKKWAAHINFIKRIQKFEEEKSKGIKQSKNHSFVYSLPFEAAALFGGCCC